jgi:hypothetical protein
VASAGVSGQIVHGFDAVIELFMKYGAVHSFFYVSWWSWW